MGQLSAMPVIGLAAAKKVHYAGEVGSGVPLLTRYRWFQWQFDFLSRKDDAQEYFSGTRFGGSVEFVADRLQGHKNSAGERAIEGPSGGTSEREWPTGEQSGNSDRCTRCVDERERGA